MKYEHRKACTAKILNNQAWNWPFSQEICDNCTNASVDKKPYLYRASLIILIWATVSIMAFCIVCWQKAIWLYQLFPLYHKGVNNKKFDRIRLCDKQDIKFLIAMFYMSNCYCDLHNVNIYISHLLQFSILVLKV